ncbi:RDD family protein [Haliea sp. AH-315-K21]|uniref:RDD family protein n=1 Tax=SAR86 cluster bacterium TaxID=2030880 RepID=A0A2A5CCN0_9GAMM|nr:RDD family protein [Haliea sp. AH-315-K21]PCJ41210.1 MAG: RDD family protein [SAR86 cluster bacterium]
MRDSNLTATNASAALWRRISAMIYDSIVIIAIWIVIAFVVLSAFGIDQAQMVENDRVVMDPYYRITLLSSMLLSAYLFFAWFWTHSGQTLGMQAWKLRVQNADASAISYKQSLIRCVIAPFSFVLFGAGYLYMFFNAEKQTLPDLLSHSVVVQVSWDKKVSE